MNVNTQVSFNVYNVTWIFITEEQQGTPYISTTMIPTESTLYDYGIGVKLSSCVIGTCTLTLKNMMGVLEEMTEV